MISLRGASRRLIRSLRIVILQSALALLTRYTRQASYYLLKSYASLYSLHSYTLTNAHRRRLSRQPLKLPCVTLQAAPGRSHNKLCSLRDIAPRKHAHSRLATGSTSPSWLLRRHPAPSGLGVMSFRFGDAWHRFHRCLHSLQPLTAGIMSDATPLGGRRPRLSPGS